MPPAVLTVGHSNHPLDRFVALLARHGVGALADIRRFPGSRKHPHFSRDSLAAALQEAGIEYHWLEALGGRRPKRRDESPNLGLENQSLRNYADYMLTDEFRQGVKTLLEVARHKRTAWPAGIGVAGGPPQKGLQPRLPLQPRRQAMRVEAHHAIHACEEQHGRGQVEQECSHDPGNGACSFWPDPHCRRHGAPLRHEVGVRARKGRSMLSRAIPPSNRQAATAAPAAGRSAR